ncbi:hypothetical protein OQA88_5903 [Cercophora sp. LCS_1]
MPKPDPSPLHHLSRAALAFTMDRLKSKYASKSSSSSKSHKSHKSKSKSSKSRNRSPASKSTPSEHEPSRESSFSHNADLNHHLTQLAAGALAFGINTYVSHRKQKRKEKSAQERGLGLGLGKKAKRRVSDPQLAAALDSLSNELKGVGGELRKMRGL